MFPKRFIKKNAIYKVISFVQFGTLILASYWYCGDNIHAKYRLPSKQWFQRKQRHGGYKKR